MFVSIDVSGHDISILDFGYIGLVCFQSSIVVLYQCDHMSLLIPPDEEKISIPINLRILISKILFFLHKKYISSIFVFSFQMKD